jgi:hypothetical protein
VAAIIGAAITPRGTRQAAAPLPVEPLVYTPEEFARLVAEENPTVTEALRRGRVLYDQA